MICIATTALDSKDYPPAGSLPADLDPQLFPIIIQHWFGVPPAELRLQRQAERWLLEKRVRHALVITSRPHRSIGLSHGTRTQTNCSLKAMPAGHAGGTIGDTTHDDQQTV